MKPLSWNGSLFFIIVATSYVVFGLDAKGCHLLAILCEGNLKCNRQVLERCGQHEPKYNLRQSGKNRDDAIAIPPISLIAQWPYLPRTFGNSRKHEYETAKNQHKSHHQKSEEDFNVQENINADNTRKQFWDGKSSRYDDRGEDVWGSIENNVNGLTDTNERIRNMQKRFTEDKTYSTEDMNLVNNYHAGVDHHGDDLRSDIASHLYSRLVRLAKLQDVLTREQSQLSSKTSERTERPKETDLNYQDLLYNTEEFHEADNQKLHDEKHLKQDQSGSSQLEELKNDLNRGEALKKPSFAYQKSNDLIEKQRRESKLHEAAQFFEDSTSIEDKSKHQPLNEKSIREVVNEDNQINRREETKSQPEVTVDENFIVVKKRFQPVRAEDVSDISEVQSKDSQQERGTLILRTSTKIDPNSLNSLGSNLQKVLWGIDPSQRKIFTKISVDSSNNKEIDLQLEIPKNANSSEFNPKIIAEKINTDQNLRNNITKATGLAIVQARSKRSSKSAPYALPKDKNWDEFAILTAIVGGCTLALIVASVLICSLKRRGTGKKPIELQKKEAFTDYEELCRTQMAVNTASSPRTMKAIQADRQRHGLVDGQGKVTKKTWREESLAYNMDISTGHVILSYMEEHLKDENKLSTEWDALCNYKADLDETTVGADSKNASKNRYSNVLPYDHTRVKLRETSNVFHSDYINASYITDADPRNPAYIATQGPLDNTVADFWQMIWEQGVVVIVNLTRLSDMGLPQCHRYWPEEGSDVYNTYQVHLISEHIWCDDYIVRSFYLKHLLTAETRTVTQFHFLTWPDLSIPESPKPILEFRRKVNKCYRGQACPIVVHCNNGIGRTGTYILIDMVLKKMIKGTKEIDIAATLEHLRDQRPDMVKTKAQFEFTLASVAEEVTAILSSLSG